MKQPPPSQWEMTPDGEQPLIAGVQPITMDDRLTARMEAPLASHKPQKPLDIGLFDEIGGNQLELF